MKKTLSTLAAAVLLASSAMAPAFAQTSPAPASPAPASPAAPATPAPAMPAKPMNSAAMPASSASAGGYVTEQATGQVLANDFIGKSVYNAQNKSIGDISNLVFEQKGSIVAAVIGVGGFLGIGQKNVAVPMDKITIGQENGNIKLTTTETAESLQAAPEFKTLADKQAQTDKTTTSSTTMPAGGATTPSTTPAAPSK